jgi:hypothetical protein
VKIEIWVVRAEGLELNFDRALTVNTLDAHRGIHMANERNVASAAEEGLMRAHSPKAPISPPPETLTSLLGVLRKAYVGRD